MSSLALAQLTARANRKAWVAGLLDCAFSTPGASPLEPVYGWWKAPGGGLVHRRRGKAARRGFEECDPASCRPLQGHLLDHRDVDGVYDADEELELDPKLTANPIHRLYIQARVWMAQHRRTHPSINERRQALLSQTANSESRAKIQHAIR